MRQAVLFLIAAGVLLSAAPPVVHAGTAGRRNTAIAATAVAAGAWSNGTGRKGRRNTALLATAGAAYAWKRHADKKKSEKRPARAVRVAHATHRARPVCVPVAHRRPRPVIVERAPARASRGPECPCGRGCGFKEYEQKSDGETKIKYLCGAEYERKASGETKFKR